MRKKNSSGRKNHISLSGAVNLEGKNYQNSKNEHDLVQAIPVQQSGPEFKNGSKIASKIDQIGIGGRGACNPQADSRGFFNPSTGSRGFYNPQADNIQHSGQEFTNQFREMVNSEFPIQVVTREIGQTTIRSRTI